MKEKWDEMIVRSNREMKEWRELLNEDKDVKKFRIINESDYIGVQYRVQYQMN